VFSGQHQKTLMEKSLQCIHLARTIRDRSPDPTAIPGEDAAKIQTLLTEANRLRGLANLAKQQDELESWGAQPDAIPAALAADAAAAVAKLANGGEPAYAEANRRRQVELFAKAMRTGWRGEPWFASLDTAEKASLIEDATGEVIVPHDIAGPIFKTLPRLAVFRAAGAAVRPTSSNKVDLRSLTGATAGWGKLELGATPATDAGVVPNTPADTIEVHDLLALAKLGVDELADTDANIVALVQEITSQQFAQQEDDAYGNGTGTSKPWGIAMRATAGPMITQGVTASANATVVGDDLKKLPYQVPERYRTNGKYFSSSSAALAIALLKDANSNYLWQPSVRAGEPDTLFGKGFVTMDGLPALTASTAIADPAVMFGDPALGYLIADRQRITMQRLDELFAADGLVGFLFKLRVGGDVSRPAAWAKYLL